MATPEKKIVKLQVNTTGAWRDVMRFAVEDKDQVLRQAAELFKFDPSADVRLRIIVPGDTAPLLTYKRTEGEWKPWGVRA